MVTIQIMICSLLHSGSQDWSAVPIRL
uniref:Uncharacterized protein n=1 Tax=Anguilla anguilla TaxID=7936 RepID=A0A0E9XSS1_ANGAN